MGRFLKQRRLGLIAAVAWLIAVSLWWRSCVSIVASRTIPMESEERFLGVTDDGLAIIGRLTEFPNQKRPWRQTGPFRLWDLDRGVLVREFLTQDDELVSKIENRRGRMLIRSGNELRLCDSETGATIRSFADADNAALFGDGRLLLGLLRQNVLTVVDAEAGDELWSQPCVLQFFAHSPDLVRIVETADGRTRSGVTWRDQRTGESRSGMSEVLEFATPTNPSSSLVVCKARDKRGYSNSRFIFDLQTQQILWRLPDAYSCDQYFVSEDESEILQYGLVGKTLAIQRWDARTGIPKTPEPADFVPQAVCRLMGNGKHIALRDWRTTDFWLRTLAPIAKWIPHQIETDLINGEPFHIYDVATGEDVGIVGRNVQNVYLGSGERIVEPGGKTLSVYGLPPRRNWLWLIGWGLGPIAATIAVRAAVPRLRQLRTSPA